jgi:hypothetical protein
MRIDAGKVVGIFVCSTEETCCFCDKRIETAEIIKKIGNRFACMPCVDKALEWMVEKWIQKRMAEREPVNAG